MKSVLVAIVLCAASAAFASEFLRLSGAPLSRSVRNESNAAIDRGRAWLASRQNPDGSWPGGVRATAVALLALSGDGESLPQGERDILDKGVAWLKDAPVEENAAPDAQAWRALALAVLAQADLPPVPYPADTASAAERSWWFAHAVNGLFGGELPFSCDGEPAAWRGPLAARFTTTQEIDARGRGHWNASVSDTAFAVLLLREL